MKGPRRIIACAAVVLAGCGGGDTLNPRAEPPPPPASPPPVAASIVIEIPKILKDYLTHSVVDLGEWVSADTTFHLSGAPQIRVTARDPHGRIVTGAEPAVAFANGNRSVAYRSRHGDGLEHVWLRQGSRRGGWSIVPGETPAETQFLTVTATLGDAVDSLVVILPTTLDVATDPRTLPYGITLDDVEERVSTPLNWFTSRAGAADISYEFLVGEDPIDDGGPPVVDLVRNAAGELEITALRRGRQYVNLPRAVVRLRAKHGAGSRGGRYLHHAGATHLRARFHGVSDRSAFR